MVVLGFGCETMRASGYEAIQAEEMERPQIKQESREQKKKILQDKPASVTGEK